MLTKYVATPHGRRLHKRHPEFPRTHTACGMNHMDHSLQPTVKRPEQGYPLCRRCERH